MSNDILRLVPDGFVKSPSRGPFWDINGPVWQKTTPSELAVFGFVSEQRHTNSLGFVHGGMIATFLDGAMAQTVYNRHRCRLVTLDLNVGYKHVVPAQRWIEASVSIEHADDNHVTATARLMARKSECATATGLYRLFPGH